jgi:putative transposase
MARLARVVVPRYPHHVTQRGNGRARTFFGDADYALYRAPSNRAGGSEAFGTGRPAIKRCRTNES